MSSLLTQYMAELQDLAKPLSGSKMVYLSGLSPEEVEVFWGKWPDIDVVRRRQIVGRLVELAEDNLELDFDEVFRACLADADSEVRTVAIGGLWGCDERPLLCQLIRLLQEDKVSSVRAAAAAALRKFALLAESRKLPASYATEIEGALLTAFNDEEEQLEVRRRALEAISPLSEPVVADLIRRAYHSDNLELRISALYAMGQNCNPIWLPILLGELHSPNPEMRFEAVRACGELENEEAVPYLIELTWDHDLHIRTSAVEALGKIGGSSVEEVLHQCLTSPEEAIREAAKEALEEMDFWKDPLSL